MNKFKVGDKIVSEVDIDYYGEVVDVDKVVYTIEWLNKGQSWKHTAKFINESCILDKKYVFDKEMKEVIDE